MKKYFSFFGIIILIASCSATKHVQQKTATTDDGTIIGGKLFTAVWMQRAAEYKALCEQAYNIATLRLQQFYNQDTSKKPLAIITDIDETFLNNSAYAVHQTKQGKDYATESWIDWTSRSIADTLCGALGFFKYAASKGINIFYITNRSNAETAGTLRNLQKFGFPDADEKHLLTMNNTSSKEDRRLQVEKNYNVILFLGDNLGDFSAMFDQKTEAERSENVLSLRDEFGKRFIMLPNPNYGDWESAIYDYKNFDFPKRDSIFKADAVSY